MQGNNPNYIDATTGYAILGVHFAVIFILGSHHLLDYFTSLSAFGALLNYGARFATILIISGVISTITYRLIELPMQMLEKTISINRLIQVPDSIEKSSL